MKNFKTLVLLTVLSSLSIASWAYAWTYSTSVGNGDSISADKWNSIVAQLIAVSVNPDWNASTGYARILNKPTIPAAQVNSDWNAAGGVAQILNKPVIPAAQVNSDWNAASGVAQILNKPTIPAAQVNSDWNAASGPASILNKPWGVSGSNVYTNLAGNVGIGMTNPSAALDVSRNANASGYEIAGSFRVTNNAGGTNYTRVLIGQNSINAMLLEVADQSNTKGNMLIQPWGGNVAIGSTNPQAKLDVNGTIKATKLNVSGGAHFKMNLAYCSGPCAGNHPLSTWVSLSGYTWSQVYNTDTANFVKSGGTVTLSESGVYMIRLQAMAMPSAATSYMGAAYYCPYINGSANCLGDVGVEHRYGPAGSWSQGRREYVAYLSAGTTVSYGIHTIQAMSYWCHDSYCSLEIIRIN